MRDYLIIGAGSTLNEYNDKIVTFINTNNIVTIGVNNMTHKFIPDYHLWTNTGRFEKYKDCINNQSKILIGSRLLKNCDIDKHIKNYEIVYYTDDPTEKISYDGKYIRGFFRTAGCLAIYWAHLHNAKKIYVVGMDGYTLCHNGNQHCYGSGMTDFTGKEDIAYEYCKDNNIYNVLRNIDKNGVKFEILTPTVYTEFHNDIILGEF